MNQTVFQVYGKENKGSGQFWTIIIVVTLILVVGVYVFTDGQYIAIGPSPLLILIIWFATKNKKEEIKFFVNQHNADFEFGWHDKNNKMHGPFPIDEYTYWCYERSATNSGWNYDLNFQINSKNATIYLKQQIVGRNPPDGWSRTPQKINDGSGVYIVPDLVKLAAIVDAASATNDQSVTQVYV